ncbi:hypothetical protein AF71_00004970 [Rhizobium sp. 57MFTsu3.2]|nr:hypothetical protein [Rhizobium sp. 57MFTsu3.2]
MSSLILSSSNRRKRNRTGYRCRTAASIFAHSSASPKEKVLDVRGDRAWRKAEIVAARVGLRPRLYKSPSHQALQPIPSQIPETIAARYPRRARTSAATALLEQGQASRKRQSALPKSRCRLHGTFPSLPCRNQKSKIPAPTAQHDRLRQNRKSIPILEALLRAFHPPELPELLTSTREKVFLLSTRGYRHD